MKHAIIENGIVINVIDWDGLETWAAPEGAIIVQSDIASIGWSYNMGTFTPPPPPSPPPPSAGQLRLQTFTDDPDYQDLYSRLTTATPAQIKAYVNTNVTDLASAKALLIKIILLMIRI